jgi:hypothetical protein
MTTTAERYRLNSRPSATTAPDLMGVLAASRRVAQDHVSEGSTTSSMTETRRAELLASLAELSVRPDAGIDRALLMDADAQAWGLTASE